MAQAAELQATFDPKARLGVVYVATEGRGGVRTVVAGLEPRHDALAPPSLTVALGVDEQDRIARLEVRDSPRLLPSTSRAAGGSEPVMLALDALADIARIHFIEPSRSRLYSFRPFAMELPFVQVMLLFDAFCELFSIEIYRASALLPREVLPR